MFKELFESKLNNSSEPFLDPKYDQWNNPGQVINILKMKPLSVKQTRDIVQGRYTGKIDLDMMQKKGYVSISDDIVSATDFGRAVLSYLSGAKPKPKGYKGK